MMEKRRKMYDARSKAAFKEGELLKAELEKVSKINYRAKKLLNEYNSL